MEQIIPLFPLKLVVFPDSKYPLHIFEPRYKNMVRDCIETNKGFGIVAKVDREMMQIGSYVRISSVIKEYENGEYDIIVQGMNRFSIDKIEVHEKGYFTAHVFEYEDINPTGDEKLIEEIKNKFETVLKKINLEPGEAFWNNFINTSTKSFKIAEKSGLTISEQQQLLLFQEENARLNFLKKHFERLDEQITKNLSEKMLIMNDGYIN